MNSLRLTNILLLIIAIPIVVLVLKMLKFIFVPLFFAMFISLLFVPLMRKMKRRGIHKLIRVATSLAIIVAVGVLMFQMMSLSSREIVSTKDVFFDKAERKLSEAEVILNEKFGINLLPDQGGDPEVKRKMIIKYAESLTTFLLSTTPQLLTTLFFVVLLLFESIDFERFLHTFLLRKRHTSIKAFKRIEGDLLKFIVVKFLVSAGTGIGTGLVCYGFGVSFPIFWGLFAFVINFVQMVGSIIAVVMCSLFAFVELELGSILLYFVICVSMVQVIFGSILEPILMGKSFSINIIVVLVMLMFWGYVWGIPGMILSIPLTVFAKIILEQFEKTKRIAELMR